MQSPDFEIYHFFYSRPSNIRLHHHDFFEIYYLRSGKMDYIVDGQHHVLHPGNLLFIAPDQFHRPDVASTSDFERFVLWVHPAFMNSAFEHFPGLSADLFSGARISNFLCPDESQRKTLEMLLFSLEQESCSSQAYRQTMCHSIPSIFYLLYPATFQHKFVLFELKHVLIYFLLLLYQLQPLVNDMLCYVS